jgi:hypothetical protein
MSVQAQSTADRIWMRSGVSHPVGFRRLRSERHNTTENAADIADLRTALKIDNWRIRRFVRQ